MKLHTFRSVLAALAVLTLLAIPAAAIVCGDSEPDPGEQCDDGNTQAGDGCSATCQIEAGSDCTAAIASVPGSPPIPPIPSACYVGFCGEGVQGSGEACDDANLANGDGCDDTCQVEDGFSCTPATAALEVLLDGNLVPIPSACGVPPQALCKDDRVVVDPDMCSATASIDDGSNGSVSQDPAGPYPLGETTVVLTASNGPFESTCEGTVTVVDEASPVISSNAPATIEPPDAPISFTATATDNCSVGSVLVTEYDCYKFTKKGKRIDKTDSCQVSLDGDTVTIIDSGGVGTTITWRIVAQDGSGNTVTMRSAVEVVIPGNR